MLVPWRWVVAWGGVIQLLLLWPSPPSVPQAFNVPGLDKLVHAGLFAVLAVLVSLAADRRPAWWAWAGSALYGALTEFEQWFVPSRSMSVGDFLADAAGAAIGLALLATWARSRREFSR